MTTGDTDPETSTTSDNPDTGTSTTMTGETGSSTSGMLPTTGGPGETCGDGEVQAGEACDDGNQVEDDGCDSACRVTVEPQWSLMGDLDSSAQGVALDLDGAIYVAGSAAGDALVRKLDPQGDELLTFTFAGAEGLDDWASAIAVAEDGSIYVAGREGLSPVDLGQAWLRKYDPAGAELWAFAQPPIDLEYGTMLATAVAVHGDRVYTTFVEMNENSFASLVNVHAFDADGAQAWSVTVDDALHAVDVTTTAAGDVLVAGGTFHEMKASDHDARLIMYSADGQELFRRVYLDQEGAHGIARGVAVNVDGDIALAGHVASGGDWPDIWLARLDSGGDLVWSTTLDGAGFLDQGEAVTWTGEELFVGGWAGTDVGFGHAWVGRFTGDGDLAWNMMAATGGVSDVVADATWLLAVGSAGDRPWIAAFEP
jgi:cysteine-rich repeat protein